MTADIDRPNPGENMTTAVKIIPQYLKSTDPEVLAHMDHERARFNAYRDRVREFEKKHGADRIYESGWLGIRTVARLEWDDPSAKPKGWTKDGRPFKNNQPTYDEYRALRFDREAFPGLPGRIEEDGPDLTIRAVSPGVVVHNGAAYAFLNIHPEKVRGAVDIGTQWAECLGSEYAAAAAESNARSAYEDQADAS